MSSDSRRFPTPQMLLRRSIIALLDLLFLNLSYVAVCGLKYSLLSVLGVLIGRSWYISIIYIVVLTFFGLYNSMWE